MLPVVSIARPIGCSGACPRPGGDAAFRISSSRIASSLMGPVRHLQHLPANRIHFHGVTALLVSLTRCCSRMGGVGG